MAIQRRLMFVVALLVVALVLYGTGKYYSTLLVLHVVEQSLAQKAPAGIDSHQIRARLRAFLAEAPDQNKRMERMFRISEYLEKVQYLTHEELNELVPLEKSSVLPAP
jgi:hypothetical protein